uniref:Protein kinase domain-containing protein n=1 Tax=Meloidogyne javanica TaxID=6303 RepID=A0A915MEM5_MELJA
MRFQARNSTIFILFYLISPGHGRSTELTSREDLPERKNLEPIKGNINDDQISPAHGLNALKLQTKTLMEQALLNLTSPEDLPEKKYLDPIKDGLGDIQLPRIKTSFQGHNEELLSLRPKIKSAKDKSAYPSRDKHTNVFRKSDIFEESQTAAKHKSKQHIKSNLKKQSSCSSCPESLLTNNGDHAESHSNYDKLYHTTDDIFVHRLKPIRTKKGGNYENESNFDGSERTSIIELRKKLKNSKRNVIDEYDRLGSNVSKKSSTSPRSPLISSQPLNETHLDLTQQYSKNDENITNGEFALIEFKSEMIKKHRFVKVALKEMIGNGGVAEVYKGLCCDTRNEIEVAVKLVGFNTINIGTGKGPETLEDLLSDPKNEMRVFKAFHKEYNGYSEESGIIEMIDGGEISNVQYSEYAETKHDFKYVIITELGTKNFLKYIGDKIYERNGLSESELKEELVKPATVQFRIHNVAIHMDFKPQNLVFDSKNELKAIDFGGSLLFADIDVEKEVPVILVGRRTTTRYFLPPELHSLLKSNLDKHYNAKDYASTKTDTWEFGILIFQMILLNERRYSTIDIDRWLYDHLLDGEEANRLSAKGIIDFLTSKCRIINKNKTFENFLEFGLKTKKVEYMAKEPEIIKLKSLLEYENLTEEYKSLLSTGQQKLLNLEEHEIENLEECDRHF